MGTIIHKTMIVTGHMPFIDGMTTPIQDFHAKVLEDAPSKVSALIAHQVNGDGTFMVVSSGSKYGWMDSVDHDAWLEDLLAEAQSLGLEAFVVAHGEQTPEIEEITC